MNTFEKTIEMLSEFDWGNPRQAGVTVVFEMEDKKVFSQSTSTYEKPHMTKWTKEVWETYIYEMVKRYRMLGFKPLKILSLTLYFDYESWEVYHLECTDVGAKSWFNRVLVPAPTISVVGRNADGFLVYPIKEFYLSEFESMLIDGAKSVVLASKVVDPHRLHEAESSLPIALANDGISKEIRKFAE